MNNESARLASKVVNAAALATVVWCAGCATSIPAYNGGPAVNARAGQTQGLWLQADPFADRERAETYFKVNPAEKGIAIIHLRAENQSADATWLVTEQQMTLVDNSAQGNAAGNQDLKSDLTSANTMGFAGALLGSPILIQMGYTHTFVEKNFVDKEWRNQTLSPGQSAHGFIYFDASKNPDWFKKKSLRVECLNVRNHQINTFLVPLAYEHK